MRAPLTYFIDVRFWYAVVGVVMSIAAHEAFHLIANMGNVEKVAVFPNLFTIMEVTVSSPGILTHEVEEVIAYTITILILLITIIDVFAINDSRDPRSVNQILQPKNKSPIKRKQVTKKV